MFSKQCFFNFQIKVERHDYVLFKKELLTCVSFSELEFLEVFQFGFSKVHSNFENVNKFWNIMPLLTFRQFKNLNLKTISFLARLNI